MNALGFNALMFGSVGLTTIVWLYLLSILLREFTEGSAA